jgi:hypothetical protein
MAHSEIDDALWDDFHAVVNMTSRELRDWLETDAAGTETETLPTRRATSGRSPCSESWPSVAPT